MKGVKTMSLANATSKRFQSDDIIAQRVHLPGNVELTNVLTKLMEENKKMEEMIRELSTKVKELEDKYEAIETTE